MDRKNETVAATTSQTSRLNDLTLMAKQLPKSLLWMQRLQPQHRIPAARYC